MIPWPRGADRQRQAAVSLAGVVAAGVLVTAPSASFVSATAPVSSTISSGTLDAPAGLAAACVALTNKVTLTWTASSSPLVSGYAILRSTTTGGPYSLIGTVSGRTTTTFTDTISTLATQYYVVQASRNTWTSPSSNQAGVRNISLGVCASA